MALHHKTQAVQALLLQEKLGSSRLRGLHVHRGHRKLRHRQGSLQHRRVKIRQAGLLIHVLKEVLLHLMEVEAVRQEAAHLQAGAAAAEAGLQGNY